MEAILVWPVVIYVSLKFVMLNIKHFSKMEQFEELGKSVKN